MDSLYLQNAILELLKGRPSEVGARLKQRLNRTLVGSGLQALNEQQFGYRKFSDFLIGELGQHLTVEKSAEGGDITVSLKGARHHVSKLTISPIPPAITIGSPVSEGAELPVADSSASWAAKEAGEAAKVVRGDVWQAFANLNASRKRYLDRTTGQIIHFLEGIHSDQEALVNEQPHRFAEIALVDGQTQKGWMHSFLASGGLPAEDVSSLERLLDEPYSSKLNLLFARALGQRQSQWKQFRAQCMGDIIEQWAEANGVPSEMLKANRGGESVPTAGQPQVAVAVTMGPREQAQRLLAMMDDRDIVTIAIPALLSCVLAKSRF